jgi:hypothetical protein
MGPEEIKLPQVHASSFLTAAQFHKEWVIDPPPFLLRCLSEDQVKAIYKVKLEGLAQIARLEIQMKEIEATTFEKVGKLLG